MSPRVCPSWSSGRCSGQSDVRKGAAPAAPAPARAPASEVLLRRPRRPAWVSRPRQPHRDPRAARPRPRARPAAQRPRRPRRRLPRPPEACARDPASLRLPPDGRGHSRSPMGPAHRPPAILGTTRRRFMTGTMVSMRQRRRACASAEHPMVPSAEHSTWMFIRPIHVGRLVAASTSRPPAHVQLFP